MGYLFSLERNARNRWNLKSGMCQENVQIRYIRAFRFWPISVNIQKWDFAGSPIITVNKIIHIFPKSVEFKKWYVPGQFRTQLYSSF